jgi:hypothetical protein
MNNSDNLALVQGPSTVTCMTYDSDLAITTPSAPYSGYWVWAGVNTNLCTEFLLQVWKHQEDLAAMILASKNQQHE